MSTASDYLPEARLLAKSGAVLFLISLATGGMAALALSGDLPADGHIVLGAHVSALTGALILFAVAYTMPMLRYTSVGRSRIAWSFIVANYANWIISTGKAFPGVHGVGKTGVLANDVVFVLLNLFVVLPSFAGAGGWIWGFKKS